MTPVADEVVRLEKVHKRFGRKVVFRGLDLDVQGGETLAIVGRSGIGKSMLLKLVLGLVRPDAGRVVVRERDVSRLSERELREVRLQLGMVFQAGALFDSLPVFDNVAYGLVEHDWAREEIGPRVRECLRQVDLAGTEQLLPEQLSGGMKKREAIARALAPRPEILLYDEPTTGLDPRAAGKITHLVRTLAEGRVTSLVVTHDMDCVYEVADRIALIDEGRVVWTGEAQAAQADPPLPLRRFLGEDDPGAS
jgi:phospholipid/cholesterol/gamma-HCH transport system ATP-binding protein